MCVHIYAQFHFNITSVSVEGVSLRRVGREAAREDILVLINHSITHLSEFRQGGEREGQGGGGEKGGRGSESEWRNAAGRGGTE